MKRHVLSVGQCGADDARLARVLAVEADAHMDRALTAESAREKMTQHGYDLVIVNRVLDGDGQSGVEFIEQCRASGAAVPLMLISDYPDAQARAVAAGAAPGFGKGQIGTPEVGQVLRQALGSSTSAGLRQ